VSDPATKNDLDQLEQRIEQRIDTNIAGLRQWMVEREVQSIRWFVGTQIAYVVVTLGAMYFMLQRLH
jgi:hypothetical protein